MPRPPCIRVVRTRIGCRAFGPWADELTDKPDDAVILYTDEAEALRYADLEGMYQEAASRRMGISRQTFGRIIESARRKVATAILYGRTLRIEDKTHIQRGAFDIEEYTPVEGGVMNAKIAIVSDDGSTISRHFGRAAYYVVIEIEDGKVISKKMRGKVRHVHGAGIHEHGGPNHGFDVGAQHRHAQMSDAIADCSTLIAGGMGSGAYSSLRAAGIIPIVTALNSVDEAVQAFLSGTLVDHPEYLH